jgi:hypothetical protein
MRTVWIKELMKPVTHLILKFVGAPGVTTKAKLKGADLTLSPAILLAVRVRVCGPGVNAGNATSH